MPAAPQAPSPIAPDIASWFMLRPGVAFLNHGSFGAIARDVFKKQSEWRRRIEAEPVEIIARQNDQLIAKAKRAIGQFLNMSPGDFGLVTNATEGINAYLRSLRLEPGDELLTTDHVYNAVRQAMRYIADSTGAVYREVEIRTPVENERLLVEPILAALNPRTKLLVIDHVTSPTALIFPVTRIIQDCARRGIDVLVDGAHAPGMLDLDVTSLGAAAYAGNLHKWCGCPRGSAFLWVRPDRQAHVHPMTISHYRGEGFAREFDWQGTRELSAWFTIPDALQWMEDLGWTTIREYNHHLALWAHNLLAGRWGVSPIAPQDGSMTGSMATLPLPEKLRNMTMAQGIAMQQSLYAEDFIEAPWMHWQGGWHLRVSCQIYNCPEEYVRLAKAIERRAT